MLACIESGIAGKDLEDTLESQGYTMGHEPDSLEFSTLGELMENSSYMLFRKIPLTLHFFALPQLHFKKNPQNIYSITGGWVATRSSGMKQQTYGNIEDIVSKVTVVTSVGVLEKNYLVPRGSVGPDYDQVILGSEGTLGVITNVVVRIHKKPDVRRYGSILFPDFESGTKFMYDASQFSVKPSNLRLVDNMHIQLGMALEHHNSLYASVVDRFKKFGSKTILRYDFEKISLAIYLIEGDEEDVENIESKLRKTSWKYWGISGGSRFGERTYLMTFTVCYIRVSLFNCFNSSSLNFSFYRISSSTWASCLTLSSRQSRGASAGI